MKWLSQAHTETGLVRSLNEDSVLALDEQQLWIVADGMGGHDSGDYASQLVVNRFSSYNHPEKQGQAVRDIDKILNTCNQELRSKAANDAVSVIGCTVAVLLLHREKAICSWSGDSRIYRIREDSIRLLTNDHNYSAYVHDAPRTSAEKIPEDEILNGEALTAAIGGENTAFVEHCVYPVQQQDEFIICTDGLYKELDEDDLLSVLSIAHNSHDATVQLSGLYRDRGARDNVGFIYITPSDKAA